MTKPSGPSGHHSGRPSDHPSKRSDAPRTSQQGLAVLSRQAELPQAIALLRYAPERARHPWQDWDPARVGSPSDLPPYLILGALEPSSFKKSGASWSARWQGSETNTFLDVLFQAEERSWRLSHTWRGVDGGFALFPARIPLDKALTQSLYSQFPAQWDTAAEAWIESEYQAFYIGQPQDTVSVCGIPDGAFRTILFPVSARNLRPVREWLRELVQASALPYPISVEAKLIHQAVNYVEGKAPAWTTEPVRTFYQSLLESGLAADGLPVREVAQDGSAAWTLRRRMYFVFIGVPFAGLADFLSRASTTNGPLRGTDDPELRFELRPAIAPAGIEFLTKNVTLWEPARTTRSVLTFSAPGQAPHIPSVEYLTQAERDAQASLAKAEAISQEVVEAVEKLFEPTPRSRA